MSANDDVKFKHPSYGMVGFSRGTVGGSGCYVFGSPVKTNHIITLTIRQCERNHHLNQDWYFGGKEICEVQMTELQFAQLITSLNVGQGVPCSIGYVNGMDYETGKMVSKPEVPDPSEIQMVRQEFAGKAKELGEVLSACVAEVEAVVEAAKLSKKDKEAISKALAKFEMEAKHNLPFIIDQLTRSAGKVVGAAKSELLAWTDFTLKSLGLSHLKAQAPTQIETDEIKDK
jgi:hypothetical protein